MCVARALASGEKLVLGSANLLLEPEKLFRLMDREQVHFAELSPSILRNLLRHVEQRQLQLGLLKILAVNTEDCGAEERLEAHSCLGPGTRLITVLDIPELFGSNLCFKRVARYRPGGPALVPCRPFAKTRAYLLGVNLEPVPSGCFGELHVAGDALTIGYFGCPVEMAERYLPNPFGDAVGTRLFATRHLARYLPDGDIEFKGPVHGQLQVRGRTIDVKAIEALLRHHEGVHDAFVLTKGDSGGAHTVAYVVNKEHGTPSGAELREYLAQSLADYMVPSAFIMMETLPLTPEGRVDRIALPSDGPRPKRAANRPPVAPRELLEVDFMRISEDILEHS
jgi:non-ribosomal peptide synthetase component E (peptide arylation enzyme)